MCRNYDKLVGEAKQEALLLSTSLFYNVQTAQCSLVGEEGIRGCGHIGKNNHSNYRQSV